VANDKGLLKIWSKEHNPHNRRRHTAWGWGGKRGVAGAAGLANSSGGLQADVLLVRQRSCLRFIPRPP
jgi:hypothetical protein